MLDKEKMREHIFNLIKKASVDISEDVYEALKKAHREEEGRAKSILEEILKTIELSRKEELPICQDTGYPSFFIELPYNIKDNEIIPIIEDGIREAVNKAILRPNAVNPITGENSGDSTGIGIPAIYISHKDINYMKISVLLKGGGSENVSTQYSLPNESLSANRDLEGVKRVVLDAIYKAQGKGCAPGIIGVCIGGDRSSGYLYAKKALLRKLTEKNQDHKLAKLEEEILELANSLGIGPMGFGGKTTLLGVNITYQYRHPASFFVTIAYNCWVLRRKTLIIYEDGSMNYD
jgi:fumarate hydratase class I